MITKKISRYKILIIRFKTPNINILWILILLVHTSLIQRCLYFFVITPEKFQGIDFCTLYLKESSSSTSTSTTTILSDHEGNRYNTECHSTVTIKPSKYRNSVISTRERRKKRNKNDNRKRKQQRRFYTADCVIAAHNKSKQ